MSVMRRHPWRVFHFRGPWPPKGVDDGPSNRGEVASGPELGAPHRCFGGVRIFGDGPSAFIKQLEVRLHVGKSVVIRLGTLAFVGVRTIGHGVPGEEAARRAIDVPLVAGREGLSWRDSLDVFPFVESICGKVDVELLPRAKLHPWNEARFVVQLLDVSLPMLIRGVKGKPC